MARYTLIAFKRFRENTDQSQNMWMVTLRVTKYWGFQRRTVVKSISFNSEYSPQEIEAGMQSHIGISYKRPEDILKGKVLF